MDDIYLRLKESAFKLEESAHKRYDYDAAGKCFSPIRVAFNQCRTIAEKGRV